MLLDSSALPESVTSKQENRVSYWLYFEMGKLTYALRFSKSFLAAVEPTTCAMQPLIKALKNRR